MQFIVSFFVFISHIFHFFGHILFFHDIFISCGADTYTIISNLYFQLLFR